MDSRSPNLDTIILDATVLHSWSFDRDGYHDRFGSGLTMQEEWFSHGTGLSNGTLHQVGALTPDGWAVSCYLFNGAGSSHDCYTRYEHDACTTSGANWPLKWLLLATPSGFLSLKVAPLISKPIRIGSDDLPP